MTKDATANFPLLDRLATVTNVIPLIGHADRLSGSEIERIKHALASSLHSSNIMCFAFGANGEVPIATTTHQITDTTTKLYAVSTVASNDMENMDASLLMSSGFVRPLVPSDLSTLIQQLFEPENMQWLRHCAVKKLLQWRRVQLANSLDLQTQAALNPSPQGAPPSITGSVPSASLAHSVEASTVSSPSQVLVPYPGTSFYRASSPSPSSLSSPQHGLDLALQQYATRAHTDRYTEVRLAKWAEDLQRSLEAERRQQHQRVSPRGRDRWQDMYDFSKDKEADELALVCNETHQTRSAKCGMPFGNSALDPRDPLGVLAFGQRFRRNGWIALRVLGGCGIIGAVAVWTMRNWETVADFFGIATADVEIPGYGLVGPAHVASDGLLKDWGLDIEWKNFFWGGKW